MKEAVAAAAVWVLVACTSAFLVSAVAIGGGIGLRLADVLL